MRIPNTLLTSNYMADLQRVQQDMARLLRQTSTGKLYERPRDNPSAVSTSLNLSRVISSTTQYTRNVDNGLGRLNFTEITLSEVNTQIQRVRELTVQGSSTVLTRDDRTAIAQEINQLLEHTVTLSNSNFSGRYVFSGFETLTESFRINSNTSDGFTNSVTYQGDFGKIGRNIGIQRDLDVNFDGHSIFLDHTWQAQGRQMSGQPLGYSGTFEINERLIVVNPADTLADVARRINSDTLTEVKAEVSSDFRLQLTSLNSSKSIKLRDLAGTVLEDMEILPQGAFNKAQTGVTLPLTDSTGAIHDGGPLVYPLNLTTNLQDMVITLGGAANDGFTETKAIKLDAVTYNNAAELAAEIQKKADLAFGEDKLIVRDDGLGGIDIETNVQNSSVLIGDLMLGGTAPDGTADTASAVIFGYAGQTAAGFAGTDGNDRFTIDLGPDAYITRPGEEPIDLSPVEINLDASAATLQDIIDDINRQVLDNKYLSGLVRAEDDGGRLRIVTTATGTKVGIDDLVLRNSVPGPPVLATDTLGGLGFYVEATTGESAPPVPAQVQNTLAWPAPGVGTIIGPGNESFSIDLGPGSSIDGTDPAPVTITLPAGGFIDENDMAAKINNQIALSPILKNAVIAVVVNRGGSNYVDIQTTNVGSGVEASDLTLADVDAGMLANLGLAAPTIPGGGTQPGIGEITEADNMINTMIQLRDELLGYSAATSRLSDLHDVNGVSYDLAPGTEIRISSDGTTSSFIVQRFSTMQDLADAIEQQLGVSLEVEVQRDGRIRVFNPNNTVVNDISIEAYGLKGQRLSTFEERMSGISGRLIYRSELASRTTYEDERFQHLTNRIGNVDRALEKVTSTLAIIGSRTRRLDMTLTQNDTLTVNTLDLQNKNDNVDMAEAIIKLKERENVLNAALGTGSRIIPSTLFDYLR
ncbi:MAG: flagellar hook-associated protein FlgL [Planctomycetales bacterium]|nr:flagellar hook-associated protein FlgL [bacterium]UNM09087.1 MAG: flagellar hook-associated protein FlgL [Planctomycetales bacterium]